MTTHQPSRGGTLSRRSSAQNLRNALLPPLSIPSRSRSGSLVRAANAAVPPVGLPHDGTSGSPPEDESAKDRPTLARADSFSLHRSVGAGRLRARSVTTGPGAGFETPITTTADVIPSPLMKPPLPASAAERYASRSPRWEGKTLASVGEADVDALSLESRISIDEETERPAAGSSKGPGTAYGASSSASMTSSSSAESSPPATPRFTLLPVAPFLGLGRSFSALWHPTPTSKPSAVDRLVLEERERVPRRSLDSIERVFRSRSRTIDELEELRQGVSKRSQGRQGLPLWKGRGSAAGPVSPISEEASPTASRHSFDEHWSSIHRLHHVHPPSEESIPPIVPRPALPSRATTTTAVPTTTTASPYPIHSLHALLPRLGFLAFCFATSFLLIAYLLSTIPHLSLPTSLPSIKAQIVNLRSYASSSSSAYTHLLVVLSLVFVWKQAFSIPGSALVNVLIGSVYGTWRATLFTCVLTAVGSTVAFWMAKVARPVVETYMPKALAVTQRALDRFAVDGGSAGSGKPVYDRAELTSYLLLARLLPVLPYAVLNIACGVLDVPLAPFFWTLAAGSIPYNWCTTQVGDLLSLATDSDDLGGIWSFTLLIKLAFISALGVLPVFFKSQLRVIITSALGGSSTSTAAAAAAEEKGAEESEGPLMDNIGRRGREWVTTGGAHRRSGEYERISLDVLRPTSSTDVKVPPTTPPAAPGPARRPVDTAIASGFGGTNTTSPTAWKRQLKRVSWKRLSASLGPFDPFAVSNAKYNAERMAELQAQHEAVRGAGGGGEGGKSGWAPWSPRKKASVVGGTGPIGAEDEYGSGTQRWERERR